MKERGWTPDQIDDLDVVEWRKILAFEAVHLHEVTGEPIPRELGGMAR